MQLILEVLQKHLGLHPHGSFNFVHLSNVFLWPRPSPTPLGVWAIGLIKRLPAFLFVVRCMKLSNHFTEGGRGVGGGTLCVWMLLVHFVLCSLCFCLCLCVVCWFLSCLCEMCACMGPCTYLRALCCVDPPHILHHPPLPAPVLDPSSFQGGIFDSDFVLNWHLPTPQVHVVTPTSSTWTDTHIKKCH